MLINIESGNKIDYVPHQREYREWRGRIDDADFQKIWDELWSRIDGSEIQTSSWIPGSDWTGTVFQPIYEDACDYDPVASAKFFGLILWDVVRSHPDAWGFGRYALGDIPIEGLTYFRVHV